MAIVAYAGPPISALGGLVSTVAGKGAAAGPGASNAVGTNSMFSAPQGLAISVGGDAGGGNLLVVADAANNLVRTVSLATLSASTLAGGGSAGGTAAGYADGSGVQALFSQPSHVAADALGSVFVADAGNNVIRVVVVANGFTTTLAGGGGYGGTAAGFADGVGSAAKFNFPQQLALGPGGGTLYVADFGNHALRVVDVASGAVTSLAGGGAAGAAPGSADGVGSGALFNYPMGLAVDAAGAYLVVSELYGQQLRRVTIGSGAVTTLAGSSRSPGFANGAGSAASFSAPVALAMDAAYNVYVADSGNNAVRVVDFATGLTSTLVGAASAGFADGVGTGSAFSGPAGLAIDPASTVLYVADSGNNALRLVRAVPSFTATPSASSSITTSPTPSSLAVSRPATLSPSATPSGSPSARPSPSATSTATASPTATATSTAACCAVTASMSMSLVSAAGQAWQVSGGPGYLLVQLAAAGSGALGCCMGCGPCAGAPTCWGCSVAGGSSAQTTTYVAVSAGSVVMAVAAGSQAVTLLGSCSCAGGGAPALVQITSLPTASTSATAGGTSSPTTSLSPSLSSSQSATLSTTGSLSTSAKSSVSTSTTPSATRSSFATASASVSGKPTRSVAPSPTATSTVSTSSTASPTGSRSQTASQTGSPTGTLSSTASVSLTVSATFSLSVTSTVSVSSTFSSTPSTTQSPTRTASLSATASQSATLSATQSSSSTVSRTGSTTATATPSLSASASPSAQATPTYVPPLLAASGSWAQQASAGTSQWWASAASANGSSAVVVSAQGAVVTSTNGGYLWFTQAGATPSGLAWRGVAVAADGSQVAAAAANAQIYTGRLSGNATWAAAASAGAPAAAWTSLAASADFSRLFASASSSGSTQAISNNVGVWASTNSGANWTRTSASQAQSWVAVACSADGMRVVAAAAQGAGSGLFASATGGFSWARLAAAPASAYASVASSASGSALAACGSNFIISSANFGASWASGPAAACTSVAITGDGSLVVAGTASGLYASWSGGAAWAGPLASPGAASWQTVAVSAGASAATSALGVALAVAAQSGGGVYSSGLGALLASTPTPTPTSSRTPSSTPTISVTSSVTPTLSVTPSITPPPQSACTDMWIGSSVPNYNLVHLLPSGAYVTYTNGFSSSAQPTGIALDAYNNVFVAVFNGNGGAGNCYVLTPSTGAYVSIGSGWAAYGPHWIAVDNAGPVYVAEDQGNKAPNGLTRIAPSGGPPFTPSSYASGTQITVAATTPGVRLGVAVDVNSNVYFISGQGGIYKVTAPVTAASTATLMAPLTVSGSLPFYIGGSPFQATGLAVDTAGNFYLSSADSYTAFIVAAPAYNSIAPLSQGGFSGTFDVKVDPAGNVYFANSNPQNVGQIRAGSGLTTTYGNGIGLTNTRAVAVNCAGVMSWPSPSATIGTSPSPSTSLSTTPSWSTTSSPTPSQTPSQTPTPTPSPTPSMTPSPTPTPSGTPSTTPTLVSFPNYAGPPILALGGLVSTLAGKGAAAGPGASNAVGTNSMFSAPQGLAISVGGDAGGGNLLVVADAANNLVRTVSLATLSASTLAGGGSAGGTAAGYADGSGVQALFSQPSHVAADALGSVFVADAGNNVIRVVVVANGFTTTLAGGGGYGGTAAGFADGVGSAAKFNFPQQLALGPGGGTLYVADFGNHALRVVDVASGAVTSLAGGGAAGAAPGSADGVGSGALFNYPMGLAVDAAGAYLVVSELYGQQLRRVTIGSGAVTTLAGSSRSPGFANGAGSAASFSAPVALAMDAAYNVYVADSGNNAVRVVDFATGLTSTLVGAASAGFADGVGTGSAFSGPAGLAIDPASTVLYVADSGNNALRLVRAVPSFTATPSASSSITTSPTPSSLAVSRPATLSPSATPSGSPSARPSPSATSTATASPTATATSTAACCAVTASMSMSLVSAAGQAWQVSGGPGYLLVQLAAAGSGALGCCMGCGPCAGAPTCWGCSVAGGSSAQTTTYVAVSAGSVVMAVAAGSQAVTLLGSCSCAGGGAPALVQITSLPTASTSATAGGTSSPTTSLSPSLSSSQSATLSTTGSLSTSAKSSVSTSTTPSATRSSFATASASVSGKPTRSVAPSPTATSTVSTSSTASPTGSRSQTASQTGSPTGTLSSTASVSLTVSATFSLSVTSTVSVSSTFSSTPSTTQSPTRTASLSATASQSATLSATQSSSSTVSRTGSTTATATPSLSASASPSAQATPTYVPPLLAASGSWAQQASAGTSQWWASAASANGSSAVVVSAQGAVVTSTNGGYLWFTQAGATPSGLAWRGVAVAADGSQVAAAAANAQIYTGRLSGNATWAAAASAGAPAAAWTSLAASADFSRLFASASSSGSTQAISNNVGVWASTNSGANWTRTSASQAQSWVAVACSADGMRVVAAAAQGAGSGLFASATGGFSWARLAAAPASAYASVASSASGSALAACGSNFIISSANFGASWASGPAAACTSVAITGDGSLVVAGTASGLYASWSGGAAWAGPLASPGAASWQTVAVSAGASAATSALGVALAVAAQSGGGVYSSGVGALLLSTPTPTPTVSVTSSPTPTISVTPSITPFPLTACTDMWVSNGVPNYGVVHLLASGGSVQYGGFSGSYQPQGMSLDAYGNVFIAIVDGTADQTNGRVLVINPSTNVRMEIGHGYNNAGWQVPAYVALDAAGNLYVNDRGEHAGVASIVKVVPTGSPPFSASSYDSGATTYLASGAVTGRRIGVALDSASNVYFATWTGLYKIPAPASATSIPVLLQTWPSNVPSTIGGTFQSEGLAFDGANNLYIGSVGGYTVFVSTPPSYSSLAPLTSGGYSATFDVKVDPAGNVYMADANPGNIGQIRAGTRAIGPYYGSFTSPRGVAVNCTGVM